MRKKNVAKKNEINTETGFSIFELIVVIFILSTILVAIASNMARTVRVLWENRSRTFAVNMAQNCIEDFNFSNSWRDWVEFRTSDFDQYCNMGTAGLWDGNGGLPAGWEEMPAEIGNQVSPFSEQPLTAVELLPAPTQAQWAAYNAGETDRTAIQNIVEPGGTGAKIKRVFYDAKSFTWYVFEIRRYPVTVHYREGVREVGGGEVIIKQVPRSREAVVIVVDVFWERSSGNNLGIAREENDSNKYQVAKQFMAQQD